MNDDISNRLATGLLLRGSNPGGGEIFRTRPIRPWGPPKLTYRFSFPRLLKRPARVFDHPHIAPILKERALYLYFLLGSSGPVTGRALPTVYWL